jgi:hypothetical protein
MSISKIKDVDRASSLGFHAGLQTLLGLVGLQSIEPSDAMAKDIAVALGLDVSDTQAMAVAMDIAKRTCIRWGHIASMEVTEEDYRYLASTTLIHISAWKAAELAAVKGVKPVEILTKLNLAAGKASAQKLSDRMTTYLGFGVSAESIITSEMRDMLRFAAL